VDRDLIIRYLGMKARMRSLEVVANNLANASTTGFKAEIDYQNSVEGNDPASAGSRPAGRGSPDREPGGGLPGVVSGTATNHAPGQFRETGNPLNVGLVGGGFLVVMTPRGERYTRAGRLILNRDGQLVTPDGSLVVGERGPVTVPPGEIVIAEDGTLAVQGRKADRLKVVRFRSPGAELVKEGGTLFAAAEGVRPLEDSQTRFRQGVLETSNVDPIREMVTLIQLQREFEALQRGMKLKLAGEDEIGKI
jgi:flagellar basal-body rod protein FlgF